MTQAYEVALARLQEMLLGMVAAIPNLLIAVIVFLVFWFVARLVREATRRLNLRRGQPSHVALVLARLASGTLIFLGLLVGITILFPGIGAADLFSLLGIGGVAIGFAFRDILQNMLAGILILLTRPFHLGDQIISGDSEGTVEDIQVRATIIRTYDNRQVVIPNAQLFTNKVTVNTAYDRRRMEYDIGIGTGDDIDRACVVILEAVRPLPSVRADPPPEVFVAKLGESSVILRVRWWIDPPLRRDALFSVGEVLQAVKENLIAEGIDLPYPTTQVLLHDQTEETDGNRARQREGWPAPPDGSAPRSRFEVQQAQRPKGTERRDGAAQDEREAGRQ